MPDIKLFELGPTRSSRCRWTLLEAGLPYESIGNATRSTGGHSMGWIDDCPSLLAYLERLFAREHCTLRRHG